MENKKITVIRNAGSVDTAKMPDGTVVAKSDKLFVPEMQHIFPVPDYESHFVFYWSKAPKRYPKMLCTCGSIAVVSGYSVYKDDASADLSGSMPGAMILCYSHATTGRHSDGAQ